MLFQKALPHKSAAKNKKGREKRKNLFVKINRNLQRKKDILSVGRSYKRSKNF